MDNTDETEEPMKPSVAMVSANVFISGFGFLSQAVVILIACGLEGDFSARTLMWVQAVFEGVKRLMTISLSLTSTFGMFVASKLTCFKLMDLLN